MSLCAPLNRGLVIEVDVDEPIALHPSVDIKLIVLTVEAKSGRKARLRVQSDDVLKVFRTECGKLIAVG